MSIQRSVQPSTSGGSVAVTWDASSKGAPVVTTTANAVTVAEFINVSTNATPSWQYVA